jgi:uncharacterized membrane protein
MRKAGGVMRRRGWLLFLLVLLAAVPAAARSLTIESFDVTVRVNPDGTLDVTETIRPRFTGSWNGIYRTIPIEYRTPQGFNYTLFLDVVSVTDENGRNLRHEVSRERHYRKFKIWVPNARDATRTVVLRYRVKNGLKFFEEHDELYWNVTGDEWQNTIEAASARIVLPAGAEGVRALAFTGAYGSREQEADVEVQGSEVHLRMRRALGFREGLTAVVGWNKGLVEEPGALENASLFLQSNWPLFLPILAFGLMYWIWHTRGRDPRLHPISVQYTPPEGLTPAEVGTLIDNSADMRDITATIVDLAVRGYLHIEEKKTDRMLGLWSDTDYAFHRRKEAKKGEGLKPHERKLLDEMFSDSRDSVKSSQLENKFYTSLPGLRDRIFNELIGRRYYLSRPDTVKKAWMGSGIVLGFLLTIGGSVVSQATGIAPTTFVLAGILTGAVVVIFGYFMPARTLEGSRALEGVLGFEEFLGRVEADRMDRMIYKPEMFEKYLPFAMALGVEKKWAAAFEGIYTEPPQWYTGTSYPTFQPSSFVGNLNRMSASTAAAMASAPRSSGGSGFSGGGGGGGFSGGGFGGGGGGGF